jgi:WD repeat-containing protein 70
MSATSSDDDETDFVGPPRPATLAATPSISASLPRGGKSSAAAASSSSNSSSSEGGDSSDDSDDDLELPLATSVTIAQAHSKAVTAIGISGKGSRFCSGSSDGTVALWDFHGMTAAFRSFRQFEPNPGHGILSLEVEDNTRGSILVCTTATVAHVYDREGRPLAQTTEGDKYLQDLSKCTGHVAPLTGAAWLSGGGGGEEGDGEGLRLVTVGGDGSLRQWQMEQGMRRGNATCLRGWHRLFGGGASQKRIPLTALSVTPLSPIAVGSSLGTIALVDVRNRSDRASMLLSDHTAASVSSTTATAATTTTTAPVTALQWMPDGVRLCSAVGDRGLVQAWDIRKGQPTQKSRLLYAWEGVEGVEDVASSSSPHPHSHPPLLCTVPSQSLCCYLSGVHLRCLDLLSGHAFAPRKLSPTPIAQCTSLTAARFHSSQLLLGDSSGALHICYDPSSSSSLQQPGIWTAVATKPRKAVQDGIVSAAITSDMVQSSYEYGASVRTRLQQKSDTKSGRHLHPQPVVGGGQAGSTSLAGGARGILGSSASHQLLQNIPRELWAPPGTAVGDDPREAVLRYAEQAANDPQFFGAYKVTQPVPIFQAVEEEEGEDGDRRGEEGEGQVRKKIKSQHSRD